MDTTSVQAGHASSSYALEVYSSGAVERANKGIKKRIWLWGFREYEIIQRHSELANSALSGLM